MTGHRKLSVHQEHELLLRLENAGLGDIEAQAVIQSKGNELARKVVDFIRQRGYKVTASQESARAIMGSNFLGIDKVIQHYGADFTTEQLAALEQIPFTEAELQMCKDDFILVAGYPMDIFDIQAKGPEDIVPSGYSNVFFARRKMQVRWYLIRKNPVPKSTNKTYKRQQLLLSNNEKIPRAVELVYTIILYYLVTQQRLFEKWVRCSDTFSNGEVVSVGNFAHDLLSIGEGDPNKRSSLVGLACSWKCGS